MVRDRGRREVNGYQAPKLANRFLLCNMDVRGVRGGKYISVEKGRDGYGRYLSGSEGARTMRILGDRGSIL